MKITLDENGYISGFCIVGDNGGVEVDDPEDLDSFFTRFDKFKLVDGKLVFDEEKEKADQQDQELSDLRRRREEECFPVVNRGWIWYSCLTLSQWRELRSWYLDWLNVTETKEVPERPAWIDSIDASKVPLTPLGLFK